MGHIVLAPSRELGYRSTNKSNNSDAKKSAVTDVSDSEPNDGRLGQ
jgi:hypothetical protein